jgi:mono/diheme cytochrome c family protein
MRRSYRVSGVAISLFLSGTLVSSAVAAQGDPAVGKATYEKICVTCHGTTGKGDGPAAAALPVKPQNHTNGQYMNTLKDDYLFKIIKEGGASVGKAQFMPAWGTQLKDQDIWNVIAYVRSLAVPPYQASAEAPSKPAAQSTASAPAKK